MEQSINLADRAALGGQCRTVANYLKTWANGWSMLANVGQCWPPQFERRWRSSAAYCDDYSINPLLFIVIGCLFGKTTPSERLFVVGTKVDPLL